MPAHPSVEGADLKQNLVIWMLLLSTQVMSAQDIAVSGYVRDADTDEPLAGVNVFLGSTTLGAATGPDGFFEIIDVPKGHYELIVSMIGYEVQKRKLELMQSPEEPLEFELKPIAYKLDEIQIEADFPEEWPGQLETFTYLLLGETDNAEECEFVNPEVLSFDDENEFTASTDDWLKVNNFALGYQLELLINRFIKYSSGDVDYSLESRFHEMEPESAEQANRWRENRLKAYYGSMRHFFTAIMNDSVEEEGFLTASTLRPIWNDLARHMVYGEIHFRPTKNDTAEYYEDTFYHDDFIYVRYMNEPEDDDFFEYRLSYYSPVKRLLSSQSSWIKFKSGMLVINNRGLVANMAYQPKVYGYWAFERVADALPLDYDPDEAGYAEY